MSCILTCKWKKRANAIQLKKLFHKSFGIKVDNRCIMLYYIIIEVFAFPSGSTNVQIVAYMNKTRLQESDTVYVSIQTH